jgi:hypothetical protein
MMNLQFAIALSCTETGCETQVLGETNSFHAEFSEPMIEHRIIVRPGDLLVVNRQGDFPQVVFRLVRFQVDRVVGGQIFIDTPCSQGIPMSRAERLDERIVAGDVVFAANGQIYDIAVNGHPAHSERLQAVLFPQIQAMYQQMEGVRADKPNADT